MRPEMCDVAAMHMQGLFLAAGAELVHTSRGLAAWLQGQEGRHRWRH